MRVDRQTGTAVVTRDSEYVVKYSCGHSKVFKVPAPRKGDVIICVQCPRKSQSVRVKSVQSK